jgi:hypothetical protein
MFYVSNIFNSFLPHRTLRAANNLAMLKNFSVEVHDFHAIVSTQSASMRLFLSNLK